MSSSSVFEIRKTRIDLWWIISYSVMNGLKSEELVGHSRFYTQQDAVDWLKNQVNGVYQKDFSHYFCNYTNVHHIDASKDMEIWIDGLDSGMLDMRFIQSKAIDLLQLMNDILGGMQ